ncbi:MAG: sigma factor-like helix-turn-helix DNA-binding protein [Solirubrobacteraceae bacterium]
MWLQGFGLSYAEMAGYTGDSERTIERQVLRARRSLRRL